MGSNEYLSEEKYKKNKKTIITIAVISLILSVLIGGGLIAGGVIKTNLSKKEAIEINEQRKQEAQKKANEKAEKANKRLEEIKTEIEKLEQEADLKSQECDSLSMQDPDWFTKVNQCNREKADIKSKINELDLEKFELENDSYVVYYDKVIPKKYNLLIVIGIGILLIGSFLSLLLFIFAKKREINAFVVQQNMPIAQEGIEKIAPSVGVVSEEIAKGVSQNINTDTLNNENNNNNDII